MNKRVALVLLLVGTTLAYRGMDVYQYLFSPHLNWWTTGFVWSPDGKYMTVTSVQDKYPSGRLTPAFKAGLQKKDKILAVYNARGEGRAIRGEFDYGAALRTIAFGEPWTLVVLRDTGQGSQELRLSMPPSSHRIEVLRVVLLVWPLIIIVTALFIGLMKPEDDNAFLACLLFLSFSSILGSSAITYPPGFREFVAVAQTTLNVFVLYLFMRFFLLFPSPSIIDRKAPWLKHVGLILTIPIWILIVCLVLTSGFSLERYHHISQILSKWLDPMMTWLIRGMFFIGLGSFILNTVMAKNKDEKRRMIVLLTGTLVGLLPLVFLIVYQTLRAPADIPPLWLIALVVVSSGVFPLSFVYVVVKHRVFGIRVILRRGLQYALVSRGFIIVEALLIFILFAFVVGPLYAYLFPQAGRGAFLLVNMFIITGLVVGMQKFNRPVMHAIDRRFFREAYNAQRVLTDLSHAVRRLAAQPDKLLETVTAEISDSFYPDQVAIFLRGHGAMYWPVAEGSPDGSLVKFAPRTDSDYYCHWIRLRSRRHDGTPSAAAIQEQWVLPKDAFIARYLEKVVAEEPEAIEVYLDDPKSWASALARVDSQADSRYQERVLLERLNTRLIVPLVTKAGVLGFISLGEKLSEEPYSKDNKELLLTVAEQTAIALDYAQLISQVAEQEKLKRELEIAQEVQAHLFPQTQPPMPTLDYTGLCRAARGVGGDYYDYLLLGSGKLGIALGDISGKGISAALLMASLQALLRSHAPLRGDMLSELIRDINRMLYESTDTSKYATFFYGVYDDGQRTLTYVNAGHNPPMLFRPTGSGGACETLRLQTGGMVIGLFPQAVYQQETIPLCPGDILVIFTDGISEAMNVHEEEFGEERLAALVAAHTERSAVGLRDRILTEITEFVGEAAQYDDMTLIVAKVV